MSKSAYHKIEKNVVPLMRKEQAGRLPARDQLREPGVVLVACEIACFEMTVPKAGGHYNCRKGNDPEPVFSQELPGSHDRRHACVRSGMWL